MPDLSWAETKRHVFAIANGLCEYCLTSIANTGQAMHVEHIASNGTTKTKKLSMFRNRNR